ncbi:MAG: pyruvate kinase [Candidatus Omnitrophica bacterium]|nr:pyruvate kinase [Candidatus Omnitrophota bacterium]MDD5488735.1 pyruvate kinase [Candidatus Omnitrophota bacterium]
MEGIRPGLRAKAKIVATMGPSCDRGQVLKKMVEAGLDVVRLNFSHGKEEEHLGRINRVRELNRKYRRCVKILQDLEGFRIRVGRFDGSPEKILKKRATVWLTKGSDGGDDTVIPFDYRGDLSVIRPGKHIFIDDGNIILEAKSVLKGRLRAEVLEGGVLKERKGINMPDVKIPFSSITEKDMNDLRFGLKAGVDMVAQSFVRTPGDVIAIKDIVGTRGNCKVIAKIENREAIKNIDRIIEVADGIMIARGDMGVAVPMYEIPVIQKTIIKKCNHRKKFVITATQMLEHMTEHSRPTRAETTDVANAIIDGTDYVMLSGETAVGKFPVETVKMMDMIIKYTEEYLKRTRRAGGQGRGK